MPVYNFGGILDGVTIPPLFLLIGGVVLGFFLARKFPAILPSLFAPKPTDQDFARLVEDTVRRVLDEKK